MTYKHFSQFKEFAERIAHTDENDETVLKNFMQDFFPFKNFLEIGFFTKEMKGDYKAQAERVRAFFGYKTVFEYGATPVRFHISYCGKRPDSDKEMITYKPGIYE